MTSSYLVTKEVFSILNGARSLFNPSRIKTQVRLVFNLFGKILIFGVQVDQVKIRDDTWQTKEV